MLFSGNQKKPDSRQAIKENCSPWTAKETRILAAK